MTAPRIHRWAEGNRLTLELLVTLEGGPIAVSVYRAGGRDALPAYVVRGHGEVCTREDGLVVRLVQDWVGAADEDEAMVAARELYDYLASIAPAPAPAVPSGAPS